MTTLRGSHLAFQMTLLRNLEWERDNRHATEEEVQAAYRKAFLIRDTPGYDEMTPTQRRSLFSA